MLAVGNPYGVAEYQVEVDYTTLGGGDGSAVKTRKNTAIVAGVVCAVVVVGILIIVAIGAYK